MNHRSYIALGSNIEPKMHYLKEAMRKLEEHSEITIIQASSVFETAPVGLVEQAPFYNMVIHVEVSLSPDRLLTVCQEIERVLGRKRIRMNGPRTIDLDILLFENKQIQFEHLTVPHPRMKQRAFVLVPLQEIAPTIKIDGKTINEHIERLPEEDLAGVRKIEET